MLQKYFIKKKNFNLTAVFKEKSGPIDMTLLPAMALVMKGIQFNFFYTDLLA
jgi:hypothetical protein